jgi:uncharacterized protein
MGDIWRAAREGDVGEVERLVGQDPGLLNAKNVGGRTPLIAASAEGHVGVVRWLVDKGAATNERAQEGWTALYIACRDRHPAVMSLLLEKGADPAIADHWGTTPLMTASSRGRLEVVRFLLGHPGAKATLNQRDYCDRTALWLACFYGRGGVVRALLECGADPTIAERSGTTPVAIAKQRITLVRLAPRAAGSAWRRWR